jgi:hypothetical protein
MRNRFVAQAESRMSTVFHLALGPYAEFELPSDKLGILPPETEDGERWFAERLWCDFYPVFDDTPRERYRYGPFHGSSQRDMHWEGQPPMPELPDLAGVDPQAEIEWFAREYEAELSALARHFDCSPRLRWGLLSWP